MAGRGFIATERSEGAGPHTRCVGRQRRLAAELGAQPHVVQAILGHRAIGGDLQSLYQQSRYLPEHAAALQRLADRIDAIVGGEDNVVQLRHA